MSTTTLLRLLATSLLVSLSAVGQVTVMDLYPGAQGSNPGGMITVGSRVYFYAVDPTAGSELWVSNGMTGGGTRLFYEANQSGGGVGSSFERGVAGGYLYFTARTYTSGIELFCTGGVSGRLVTDIRPGPNSSYPKSLVGVGDRIFFSADDDSHGRELWTCQNGSPNAVMVKDIHPGSYDSSPDCLVALGDILLYRANDGVHGSELWRSNGTAAGTYMVKDIRPGASGSGICHPVFLCDKILFQAMDDTAGVELWESDGTTAGTKLLLDIYPGGNSFPMYLTRVGDRVFFRAGTPTAYNELWVSDGTAAGTYMVKDINPTGTSNLSSLTAVGDRCFFKADDGVHGFELWVSDGTATGTYMVRDIHPTGSGLTSKTEFCAIGARRVAFVATDGPHGQEPWISDGTSSGTFMLDDILPGTQGSGTDFFALAGSSLLFTAKHPSLGFELFRYGVGGVNTCAGMPGHAVGAPPRLTVSDPLLGGSMTLRVGCLKPGQTALAILDAPAAPPFVTLGGPIYLGFLAPMHLPVGVALPIPNNSALLGVKLALQAFVGPTATPPLGLDYTNGLLLTIGN